MDNYFITVLINSDDGHVYGNTKAQGCKLHEDCHSKDCAVIFVKTAENQGGSEYLRAGQVIK